MAGFSSTTFLPDRVLRELTDARVREPERALRVAQDRSRRTRLTETRTRDDGRLNLLAVDHPARAVTRVGTNVLGMADRRDLLARTVRILLSDAVDGVMATMDILEDLLVLHDLLGDKGGPRFLDDKVVLGSLNRGGLAGAVWELDDPMTGPTAQTCEAFRLDGAKLLLRVALEDRDSLRTLEACARAVSDLNARGLPTFLEPLVVAKVDGQWKVQKAADKLAQLVGVATALGDSSRYMWLKLPYTERFDVVAQSTTLPILLLGGESVGDAAPLLHEIHAGLAAGHNVRGVLVGRNVMYPGDQDPLVVARSVDGLVHGGWSLARATEALREPSTLEVGLDRWL